jgi:hypothetical protein
MTDVQGYPAGAAMNEASRKSVEKIEEVLGQSPAFQRIDKSFFVVRQGSAYVYLLVSDWHDRSLVRFVSQLARGVEMNPDLAIKLLRINSRLRFGSFGFVRDGSCVTFQHTLLGGATLDAAAVLATLRDVALLADEYDDEIVKEAGGQTMQQLLEASALSSLRGELEHRGWGEA